MIKKLMIVMVMAVPSCASVTGSDAPITYTANAVTFSIDRDMSACGNNAVGCAQVYSLESGNFCQIHLRRYPRTWTDHAWLSTLGHEVSHCLGATHPW